MYGLFTWYIHNTTGSETAQLKLAMGTAHKEGDVQFHGPIAPTTPSLALS